VTIQLLESLLAGARVQLGSGLKLPKPDVVKGTVPLGLDAPAPAVSVTVTVHELPCITFTGDAQLTEAEVVRKITPMSAAAELAW
jgi:hypothetical protein